MANQTDTPTSVLDPVPDDATGPPPPTPVHSTWLPLAAGVVAFVVVLVAVLAVFSGGDGDAAGGEDPATRRLAGADRYETAVAISARAFPDSAPVVYLVPTDVSAAVAASTLDDGPVLVVPPCGVLPEAIRAEIRRLGPAEVVALGDESSVCDDIVRQAAGE